MELKFCKDCNKQLTRNYNSYKNKIYHYPIHSIRCRSCSNKIKKGTFKKGQSPWNKGLTMKTDDRVRKNCEHLKGKGNPMYGKFKELNPNWRGGKSFEIYGLDFDNKLREQIRNRDNNTCQECGYTQQQLTRTLTVHHIDYNKKNNNPNNLISLCLSCHMQTNFSREDWSTYFKNKGVVEDSS